MNRLQRRASRLKGPKGETLEVRLLLVEARDAAGRPTHVRVCYDEETIAAALGGEESDRLKLAESGLSKAEFLLVWMAEGQGTKLS